MSETASAIKKAVRRGSMLAKSTIIPQLVSYEFEHFAPKPLHWAEIYVQPSIPQFNEVSMKHTEQGKQKSSKRTTATSKTSKGFTEEERAGMKERSQELKREARKGSRAKKGDGEADVLAKIAEMPEQDRILGERIHAIVKANAPSLSPKLWYGMPAYAQDGNVVCFFQSAQKFNTRYATFAFTDAANLDEGLLWSTAFALKNLTPTEEAAITTLIKKAVH